MNKAALTFFFTLTTLCHGMETTTINLTPFANIVLWYAGTYTITTAPKDTYFMKIASTVKIDYNLENKTLTIDSQSQTTPIEIGVPEIQTITIRKKAHVTCTNLTFSTTPRIFAYEGAHLSINKTTTPSLNIAVQDRVAMNLEDIKISILTAVVSNQATLIIDKAIIDTLNLKLINEAKAQHAQHNVIMNQTIVLMKDSVYEAENVDSKEVNVDIQGQSSANLGMMNKLIYRGDIRNIQYTGKPTIIKKD